MSNQLTLSGFEITDAVRLLNVQGDGAAVPGGVGVWEASTNLCTNGGFTSNTTGWSDYGNYGATLTRVTTEHKFGSAALQVVPPGVVWYEGAEFQLSGLTIGDTYTFSVWVKRAAGLTMSLVRDNAPQQSVYFISTGVWQRVSLTFVAVSTTDIVEVLSGTPGAGASAVPFKVDGAQVETGSVATPYIETDGATATRAAARLQASSSLLNATQGWIAMRVKMGYASTAQPSANPSIFEYGDDVNNFLIGYATPTGVEFARKSTAGGQYTLAQAASWAAGDEMTFVFAWADTDMKVSVNGAPFTAVVTGAGTAPALAATLFDILTRPITGADMWGDSTARWAAADTGTLTNTDLGAIATLTATDPDFNSLNIPTTFVWPAVTAAYEMPPVLTIAPVLS